MKDSELKLYNKLIELNYSPSTAEGMVIFYRSEKDYS